MWPLRRGRAEPALGSRGEKLARRFLRRRGLKILAQNYRCGAGEIDIIALDRSTDTRGAGETITFVEVKTRSSDYYTYPESAVNAAKRRRLEKIADYYLANHDAEGLNIRFDVVSIVIGPDRRPKIKYIPDAF